MMVKSTSSKVSLAGWWLAEGGDVGSSRLSVRWQLLRVLQLLLFNLHRGTAATAKMMLIMLRCARVNDDSILMHSCAGSRLSDDDFSSDCYNLETLSATKLAAEEFQTKLSIRTKHAHCPRP